MTTSRFGPVQPWWRIRMVWLAFGLPAVVVVAGFVTLYLAIQGRDLPLPQGSAGAAAAETRHAPAMQARNHAATPGR